MPDAPLRPRPNILYLHAHDAGRWIEPYGCPVRTPALAALAREGTLFRRAFCAGPTCSPSRAGLLTGMWPHETGMTGLAHRGFSLADPSRHLASFLQRSGYHTALAGVQHEFAWNEPKPYDTHVPGPKSEATHPGERLRETDEGVAARAAAWLRGDAPRDRPWFLSCGFILPHRAFPPADPADDPAYLPPPPTLPDTPETRRDFAEYRAAVASMDACAGTVLRALREAGRDGDTLVLFTVDHGPAFPWMKCQLFDGGLGVSLILRYPGNPAAGRACDALASQLDVFPTLCELAGLAPPPWLRGTSLVPLLDGRAERVRTEVFGEVTYHAAYEPMRCIRSDRWKLIRIFDDDLSPVPANIDDGPSKSVLLASGWRDRPREPVQLYDLVQDPAERRNLAADPSLADVRSDLEARLAAWMRETSDPLLAGPVPLPPRGRANKRRALSPNEPEMDLGPEASARP